MYPNDCSLLFFCKLQLFCCCLQPATSYQCPAQLATLSWGSSHDRLRITGIFLGRKAAQLLLLSRSPDQVRTGDFDSWSHVEVSWKAVRLSHGDRSLNPTEMQQPYPSVFSAAEWDFVLVFPLLLDQLLSQTSSFLCLQ